MADLEKVMKGLECCKTENCSECPYEDTSAPVGKFGTDELVACQPVLYADALSLLKAHEGMSPDEFKNELLKMFSSIWDCEIDHSIFQDTVGELMSAVMQLYTQAVKWE